MRPGIGPPLPPKLSAFFRPSSSFALSSPFAAKAGLAEEEEEEEEEEEQNGAISMEITRLSRTIKGSLHADKIIRPFYEEML
jgi:hypothetical protein